jgi:hypothetical protein
VCHGRNTQQSVVKEESQWGKNMAEIWLENGWSENSGDMSASMEAIRPYRHRPKPGR